VLWWGDGYGVGEGLERRSEAASAPVYGEIRRRIGEPVVGLLISGNAFRL